jgi:hypothetical protein
MGGMELPVDLRIVVGMELEDANDAAIVAKPNPRCVRNCHAA